MRRVPIQWECVRGGRAFAAALLAAVLLLFGATAPAAAQETAAQGQVRAFWVDTFNTRLNSPADVATVVARAAQARANALFVQVRRRGDAWYLDSLEPLPDNVPIERDFDPLRELIDRAHERGIEVHAFVIIGAIWNSLTPPADPNHVFNRHGLDPATGRPFDGRANWLTRTLLADGTATSAGGYRFGNEFWIDLGHPDAADYTLQVLLRLLAAYDIDGLHLDRIRYPEIAVSGQTPTTGTSVGYNPTSVERFNRAMGRPADAVPDPGDAAWSQWRRDQVTAFVRRVYLTVMAIRPRVKVSAAVVTFGAGPTDPAAWVRMEPYWRVYQDWRAWQEEGIVDLLMPMVYKTQHSASSRQAFSAWTAFVASQQYARHAVVGLGAYLNSLEGTLLQVREAVAPRAEGPAARGVAFFSMAATNAPVLANPLSVPAGRDTPLRTFDDFTAALLTGRTAGGQWLEPQAGFAGGVFAEEAVAPVMPWKVEPTAGHLLGTLRAPDGAPLDTATVIVGRADEGEAPLEAPAGRLSAAVETDGNGVFGAVDLAPGRYVLMITPRGNGTLRSACTVEVTPGGVARLDLVVDGLSPTLAQCVGAEASRRR